MKKTAIADFYPAKGKFAAGDDIRLRISLRADAEPDSLSLSLTVWHLDEEYDGGTHFIRDLIADKQFVRTGEGFFGSVSLRLSGADRPRGEGFGVRAELRLGGAVADRADTALHVDSGINRVVRYGFLCDFKARDSVKAASAVAFLLKLHITHAQFYDWSYRPHRFKPPETHESAGNGGAGEIVYRDLMGKTICLGQVKDFIRLCREAGIDSMAYGAVYAAGEEYLKEHPEEGLYDFRGEPFNLLNKFFIMNIREASPWVRRIAEQYRYAVEDVGFSGIHMDAYGFPKRGFGRIGGRMEPVYLESCFPKVIDYVKEKLAGSGKPRIIFNNVGNWPVSATGPTTQDAVYIEVWDPFDTYAHIRNIVLGALPFGKPVILAAYLAPFRLESNHGGARAINAAEILTAAIVSHGASHLLAGETGAVLTQGYYNDYTVLREDEVSRLRALYDFQVRYMDLFYDKDLKDVSETRASGENREYFFSGASTSADGRAGTVWTIVRERPGRKLISLINLTDQDESLWNAGKRDASPILGFTVEFPLDGRVAGVFTASSDAESGAPVRIKWREKTGERGFVGIVTVPGVLLWTIVVIDYLSLPVFGV